jgi:hypothetical protein
MTSSLTRLRRLGAAAFVFASVGAIGCRHGRRRHDDRARLAGNRRRRIGRRDGRKWRRSDRWFGRLRRDRRYGRRTGGTGRRDGRHGRRDGRHGRRDRRYGRRDRRHGRRDRRYGRYDGWNGRHGRCDGWNGRHGWRDGWNGRHSGQRWNGRCGRHRRHGRRGRCRGAQRRRRGRAPTPVRGSAFIVSQAAMVALSATRKDSAVISAMARRMGSPVPTRSVPIPRSAAPGNGNLARLLSVTKGPAGAAVNAADRVGNGPGTINRARRCDDEADLQARLAGADRHQ